MREILWFMKSPGPMTVFQWVLLTLWATLQYHRRKPIKTIRKFGYQSTVAAFSLGFVVLSSDLFWVLCSIVKWGPLFRSSVLQLIACAFRDLFAFILCFMMIMKELDNNIIKIRKEFYFGWFINCVFFLFWFGLSPSPAYTDYTFAYKYEYTLNVVWSTFFVSHIIGRIITSYIFYTLWTPLKEVKGIKRKHKISVVVPNLNEMPHFETLFLRSLAKQTYDNFEVIVVDGDSNDGSLDAIQKYDLDIKVIIDKTRNIGYLRNRGAYMADGDIIFETSSDIYFESNFFERINVFFNENSQMIAIGGRTQPITSSSKLITNIGHLSFDLIRYVSAPLKKFRPTGNFLAIRREVFTKVGGYPEVKINEDGLFGYKLDEYTKVNGYDYRFSLSHRVYHKVKRFDKGGGISGILFYLYVFRMIFPILTPILKPIENRSGVIFADR